MPSHCVSEKGGQDKVHLRWEIEESQPLGGDPRAQRRSPSVPQHRHELFVQASIR